MDDMDIIIASVKTLTVYNFYPSAESAELALPGVRARYKKNADRNTELAEKCESETGPSDITRRWRASAAVDETNMNDMAVMTFDFYLAAQKEYYKSLPLIEIDEEAYNEALNVLPPLKWGNNRGVHSFFMSEMYSGSYTNQYAKMFGKFYTKIVDVRDPETWIQPSMIDRHVSP